ncbi:putative PTS IIA-like nitrogen-regulatory protein PtsN [Flexistipes sinusarabici DSM 4947]|uniref:PTS IIA-like nitrogen-regulatory protein PtsN n=2 Tax=Flexistipes sinusarabici TaxID=2352 RepID=F8E5L4_FLESM|nr:PTS sugar transporter subunit IIA [Flexistipes sinusarabici]AEI14645.1 putative PTS IIA-like nitrogen-regulatory protein PtsN [Flexistipes sinusarabici DSM 4947]HCW93598.1 PTS galactitol transporter subunit IIC [Flexistipes sinusarabici]
MNLSDYVDEDLVCEVDGSPDKNTVLSDLVEILYDKELLKDKEGAYDALVDREKLGSTGVGEEVAIPHAKLDSIDDVIVLLAISKKGIEFESLDKQPVKVIFLVLASVKKMNLHLKTLARISRLIKSTDFKTRVLSASSKSEILNILNEEEAKL